MALITSQNALSHPPLITARFCSAARSQPALKRHATLSFDLHLISSVALQTGAILCFDKMVEKGIDAGYASKLIQYGWEAQVRTCARSRNPSPPARARRRVAIPACGSAPGTPDQGCAAGPSRGEPEPCRGVSGGLRRNASPHRSRADTIPALLLLNRRRRSSTAASAACCECTQPARLRVLHERREESGERREEGGDRRRYERGEELKQEIR